MNQLQQQEDQLRKKMEFKNRKQQELERLKQQNKKNKENNFFGKNIRIMHQVSIMLF